MPKGAQRLSTEDAIQRVIQITPLLARDTWHALRVRSALHCANEVVGRINFGQPTEFGDTYNVIQNSLALTVAVALARLFDVSNPKRHPIEEQDKASIPVLAHLMMREDTLEYLARRAQKWTPDLIQGAELGETTCRQAAASVLSQYENFSKSFTSQEALSRVRDFRTNRLSHNLFGSQLSERDHPRFDDLDLLADFARDFVRPAVLAVEGIDRDLAREEEIKSKMDIRFWDVSLSATLKP